MKKTLAIILVLLLSISMLAGCGNSNSGGNSGTTESTLPAETSAPESTTAGGVTGEIYSTGEFSVLIPDGWKAFPTYTNGDVNKPVTGRLSVFKGIEEIIGMRGGGPGFNVTHYEKGKTVILVSKDKFDDAVDLQPIALDNYTWEGLTGTYSTMGPCVYAWTTPQETDVDKFEVYIWLTGQGGEISFDDADVQAILASITLE